MANVTAPQFQQDVNNAADWANGDENTTVTMRLGQQADSPAKVIKRVDDLAEAQRDGIDALASAQYDNIDTLAAAQREDIYEKVTPSVKGTFEDGFTFDDLFERGKFGTEPNETYWAFTGGSANLPHEVTALTDPSAGGPYEQVTLNVASQVSTNNNSDVQFELERSIKLLLVNNGMSGVYGYFQSGFTINDPLDVGIDASNQFWKYVGSETLPYAVPAGTEPSAGDYVKVTQPSDAFDVEFFGASEHYDSTDSIQLAIDKAIELGVSEVVMNKMYPISKNLNLSSDFPDGDEPCLLIKNAKSLKLKGSGGVYVSNHAQGALEIHSSDDVDIGIKIKGPSDFPPLDGTTGYGEKGTVDSGYYTPFWQARKNNSLDTSANSEGGFSGAFPQYSGGTAPTWGTWNGGFIGNIGHGVAIDKESTNINIHSEIYGFNGNGITIGGIVAPISPDSKNILVHKSKIHDCFNAGVGMASCESVTISNNVIYAIGHPDAASTDDTANPGYGVTGYSNVPKNIIVNSNQFSDCKRKGVDFHDGVNLTINGNIVDGSIMYGIWCRAGYTKAMSNVSIVGNEVLNSRTGIFFKSGSNNDSESIYANLMANCAISANTVRNPQVGILVAQARGCSVNGNTIMGDTPPPYATGESGRYGILMGTFKAVLRNYNNVLSNNVVDITYPLNDTSSGIEDPSGVRVYNQDNITVSGNIVSCDAENGIQVKRCENARIFGNHAELVGANENVGNGINIYHISDPDRVQGTSFGNTTKNVGGNILNVAGTDSLATSSKIVFRVTANGTASPTVSVTSGGNYIDSVESDTYGMKINLKNIGPVPTPNEVPINLRYIGNDPFNDGVNYAHWYTVRSTSTEEYIINLAKQNGGSSGDRLPIELLNSGSMIVEIDVM